jgi:hypothetical protein
MPIIGSFQGLVFLLLPCALVANPSAKDLAFEADVPLVESQGMPCVEVGIGDGHTGLFAIDTGNVNSLLDLVEAGSEGLSLKALGPSYPNFFTTKVSALRVGGLTLGNVPLLSFDFAENKMPGGIMGALAYTAFKDRILQLDLKARRVRISGIRSGSVPAAANAERISFLTFGRHGPPIVVVHGFEINGQPVSVQVDTMYSGTMLIYDASIPKVNLALEAHGNETEFFPYTDGGVSMKVSPVKTESFHGEALGPGQPRVFFPTAGVHQPDGLFDGTVGIALFHDRVLTFDFHDNTFSVTTL